MALPVAGATAEPGGTDAGAAVGAGLVGGITIDHNQGWDGRR